MLLHQCYSYIIGIGLGLWVRIGLELNYWTENVVPDSTTFDPEYVLAKSQRPHF